MENLAETKIAIVGLGYVGLPLAIEFGCQLQTVGFDIDQLRVDALTQQVDTTLEVDRKDFEKAKHLTFSSNLDDISECNVYIVTVPTPIDASKRPNLKPLISASESIGSVLTEGNIVIYESTVYPGATEEVCVPVLEQHSGLNYNKGFYAGYSPERINPGDKKHRLPSIVKVTAGSTPAVAKFVDELYATIISAEHTLLAPSP